MPHTASDHRTPVQSPSAWAVGRRLLSSPVLWGAAATWGFYETIPYLPRYRESAERYFCNHPLEYALVALFLTGLAILVGRVLRLLGERRALKANPCSGIDADLTSAGDWDSRIGRVEEALASLPARFQQSTLVTRYRSTCEFLRTRRSAQGLEEHLKYLAEIAADRVQDSYSLLLTINWAVPIIGFLGTVVGITLAIANVTPEQLDSSLNNVTGGLAVAFDTTTVALSFSLVLVFAYNWVKLADQRVLSRVEELGFQQLLPAFIGDEHASDPVQQAQADAARQLLDRTESLIRDQTTLWRESMDGLRERWTETVDSQQRELSQSLHTGVETTLSEHAGQLAEVRREFLHAFQSAATQFQQALEFDAARRDQQDAQTLSQQQQLWERIHQSLEDVLRSHDARTEDLLDGLSERMQQWQAAIEETTRSVEMQLNRLNDFTGQLAQLTEQGQQLSIVERQLADNLAAVHAAETFEETLHNLTAAVHMLTARAKPRAA